MDSSDGVTSDRRLALTVSTGHACWELVAQEPFYIRPEEVPGGPILPQKARRVLWHALADHVSCSSLTRPFRLFGESVRPSLHPESHPESPLPFNTLALTLLILCREGFVWRPGGSRRGHWR